MANIDFVPCDISVAGRVLGVFPEKLKDDQRVPDNLSYLGNICKTVSLISLLKKIYVIVMMNIFLFFFFIILSIIPFLTYKKYMHILFNICFSNFPSFSIPK